jgi:hypothetical protein
MASRLTVIFYIFLCLEVGLVLTVLPWIHPFGLSDWADNYFLLYAARKTGLQSLQQAMASGWVRGAVTGLGLLNLGMAFWEIFHFRQTVRTLDSDALSKGTTSSTQVQSGASATHTSDHVLNHERHE